MGKQEEKGDEFELSLELSIGGGRYAKSENSRGKTTDSRSESVDRREIQALRRQQVRKDRLNKSRGVGFVEDRLVLEAQKFQVRVKDREIRERDGFSEDKNELNLSLFTETKHQMERGCFTYPPSNVGQGDKNVFRHRSRNSSVDADSEHSNGIDDRANWKTVSNRSLEQTSSAVSDYQSTSHKGGSSSDTGSHSSPPWSRQHISTNTFDQVKNSDSSQAKPDQTLGGGVSEHCTNVASLSNPHSSCSKSPTDKSKPESYFDQTNNTCSTSGNPTSPSLKETSVSLSDKHPKPNNHLNAAASAPHMPCVSATGNGPNGKTITGFLYKYSQTEVSIMCVCHGTSFSPAEFVEHAGGINVSHPLRHITMISYS